MKPGPVTLLATCLLANGVGARLQVRDLPRSDPDRAALLDAARAGEDVKFVVRDFFKAGDYAFLCAFEKERAGGIVRTDDAIDVHQYFFVRDGGRWMSLPREGGFAQSLDEIPCELYLSYDRDRPVVLTDEADLIRVILDDVQFNIRHDLDGGSVSEDALHDWQLLGRKKIARDFNIEYAKPKTEEIANQLEWQQRGCKSSACKKAIQAAGSDLVALLRSDRVSSLVWGNCWRDSDLADSRACVGEMSARPYCRPGMSFVANRKDIDRCTAEVRARKHG
jgi:hypothetical protein